MRRNREMRRSRRISVSVDKLTYDLICELSQNANMTMSTFLYTVVLLPFVAIVLDANKHAGDARELVSFLKYENSNLASILSDLLDELEQEKQQEPPHNNMGV